MTVAVVHPQRQHSHQVARALAGAGLLERYVTSLHFAASGHGLAPDALKKELSKRSFPEIPPDRIDTFPYGELAWKMAARFMPPALRERGYYHNVWLFDRMVAQRVASLPAKVVVGYENSCSATFRAAGERGKICVLDAASVHYRTQRMFYSPPVTERFLDRVNAVKEEEIQAADHILTLSGYARETYLEAGVPADKVSVIPLGVDCGHFHARAADRAGGDFRILYVGNVKLFKGIDLLLAAFDRVVIPGKRLLIIGAPGDASPLLSPLPPGLTVRGHMPHEQLAHEFCQADVFVLPSRVDGFGLVVAEAMATGVPVIVSSHVGAKDLVIHGDNGWIFESGDAAALAAALGHAYEQRDRLPSMGIRARATAEECSWEKYRAEIVRFYAGLLGRTP